MSYLKKILRKYLLESMSSEVNNWKENIKNFKSETYNINTTLISKDYDDKSKLYLFVGFKKIYDFWEYSYSFIVIDENGNNLTDYMTSRNEVNEYLPDDVKKKGLIMPIIKDLTRDLLDSQLPNIIKRETVEPVSGDSLKRYDELTNLFISEYGYKLNKRYTDNEGNTHWVLSKDESNDKNKELDEIYEITHKYTKRERIRQSFDPILEIMKNKISYDV